MKVKKEYVILAILIIGLSAYLILRDRDWAGYRLPEVPRLAKSEISRVEITGPAGRLLLQKKDENWFLSPEGYLADEGKVSEVLRTLEGLTLTALVSETKSYGRYGLQEKERIRVKAWAGDRLSRDFEVGKAAPSFRHTFVKIGTDDKVYQANGNFRGKFDLTLEQMRDKRVMTLEETEIVQVEITEKDRSVVLLRKEIPVEVKVSKEGAPEGRHQPRKGSAWESTDGKGVREEKLKQILSMLSDLRCDGYIYDRKKSDFTEPIYTLRLKGAKEYDLSLFLPIAGDERGYPGISSESHSPFLLSERQAERIMIPLDEVLSPEGGS